MENYKVSESRSIRCVPCIIYEKLITIHIQILTILLTHFMAKAVHLR